MKNLRFE